MQFLVVVQFTPSSDMNRIRKDAPEILEILGRISSNSENVFRSPDGTLFGRLIESDRKAAQIRSLVEGTVGFRNNDAVLVLEAGNDFDGAGFSRAWTWLQRRQAK